MTLQMTSSTKYLLGTGVAFTFLTCSTLGLVAQTRSNNNSQPTETQTQSGNNATNNARTPNDPNRQDGTRLQNSTRTQSGDNTQDRNDLRNQTRTQSGISTPDRNRLQNDTQTQSDTRLNDRQINRRFESDRPTDNRFDADRGNEDRFGDDRRFQNNTGAQDRYYDDRYGDRYDNRSDQRFSDQRDNDDRRLQNDERMRIDERGFDFGARFATDNSNRLQVRDIERQGMLARAGVLANDVIVSVDGQSVSSPAVLQRRLIGTQGRVPLVVLRNGTRRTIYFDGGQFDYGYGDRYGDRYAYDRDRYYGNGNYSDRYYDDRYYDDRYDRPYAAGSNDRRYSASYEPRHLQDDRGWLGVYLDSRYDGHAVVAGVEEDSPADRAGIRKGDWIISVNDNRVQSASHLSSITANADPGTPLDLEVARWDRRQVGVELSARSSQDEQRPGNPQRDRQQEEYTSERDQDDQSRTINGSSQTDSDRKDRTDNGTDDSDNSDVNNDSD